MTPAAQLSPAQERAARTTEGPLLLIAGPGSGKTHTLVERIVRLVQKKGVRAESILVCTFTEKAAAELITRVSNSLAAAGLKVNLAEMYIGTLHSICLRILDEHRERTRLKRSYAMWDQFDQQYALYRALKDFSQVEGAADLIGAPGKGSSLKPFDHKESEDVLLVREPPTGVYTVHAEENKVVRLADRGKDKERSFHLDHYCFDSNSERTFFEAILGARKLVKKVYFTGMLTHGQTDFFIDYVDPGSGAPRHYYPDFLVQLTTGEWIVFEVKADNEIESVIVQAKERFARELADASHMAYRFVPSSQVDAGRSLEYLAAPTALSFGLDV